MNETHSVLLTPIQAYNDACDWAAESLGRAALVLVINAIFVLSVSAYTAVAIQSATGDDVIVSWPDAIVLALAWIIPITSMLVASVAIHGVIRQVVDYVR
jgi:hypothetical protein